MLIITQKFNENLELECAKDESSRELLQTLRMDTRSWQQAGKECKGRVCPGLSPSDINHEAQLPHR